MNASAARSQSGPRPRRDDAAEVTAGLTSMGPAGVLEALGLRYVKKGRHAWLCCLWHDEHTPSLKVWIGRAGTLQAYCHGACDRSFDALDLVAKVFGLSPKQDFPALLLVGARLSGLHALVADLEADRRGAARVERARYVQPTRPPEPERPYPPAGALEAFWSAASPLVSYGSGGELVTDAEAYTMLEGRRLSPKRLTDLDAVRVLAPGLDVPRWAKFRGDNRHESQPWPSLGYRLVVPMFDPSGVMRSARAWRVGPPLDPDDPKRVPPLWHKARGLVMADPVAREMLQTGAVPAWWPRGKVFRVGIFEGEPDWCSALCMYSDACEAPPAMLGIVNGSWSDELAARIPDGARVIIQTDDNMAGARYAREIIASLAHRCDVRDAKRKAAV